MKRNPLAQVLKLRGLLRHLGAQCGVLRLQTRQLGVRPSQKRVVSCFSSMRRIYTLIYMFGNGFEQEFSRENC